MTDTQQGYAGQGGLNAGAGAFNSVSFLVAQMIGRIGTMKLVKVVAVTNEGGVEAVGFVDVLPLVKQTDGLGNVTDQATVFGLPYFRIQGGVNAVIMDPKVGDIGLAVISDRDISAVKESKDAATPGSRRRFSISDGVFIGGILNGVPEQYIRFQENEIEVVARQKVTITAPQIELNGAVTAPQGASIQGDLNMTGNLDVTGNAEVSGTVTGGGIGLTTHHHTGVQTGGGITGGPAG